MGRACRNVFRFYGKSIKKIGNWDNIDVYGRIIIKWISEKYGKDMEWIHLAQDREQRRAHVNTGMDLRIP
jgi:hypothetical protein